MPADKLSALLKPENLLIHPAKEDRASVVKSLLAKLVETGAIAKNHSAAAAKLIAEREAHGSTALGGGLAVPHARVHFPAPVLAFALLRDGMAQDFQSLDGEPVRFVFLLLTPGTKDNDAEDVRLAADDCHQGLLRSIITFAHNPVHCRALAGCKTEAEIWSVFEDYA